MRSDKQKKCIMDIPGNGIMELYFCHHGLVVIVMLAILSSLRLSSLLSTRDSKLTLLRRSAGPSDPQLVSVCRCMPCADSNIHVSRVHIDEGGFLLTCAHDRSAPTVYRPPYIAVSEITRCSGGADEASFFVTAADLYGSHSSPA